MSIVPTALPGMVLLTGMVPLPGASALPGTTPTPHDPSADPFLALLGRLVGPPAAAAPAPPGQAAPAVADAESETEEGTAATSEDADVETEAPPTAALGPLPVLPVSPLVVRSTVATAAIGEAAPPAGAVSQDGAAVTAEPTASAPTSAPFAPETAAPAPAPPAVPTGSAPVAVAPAAGAAPATPVAAPAATSEAPAPVAQQLFPEVVRAAVSGATPNRVVVRLQPEHLGEVRVVLRTDRSGALEVSLAGGSEARAAIREGAPELRRMLELAGSHDARVVVRHLAETSAATTVSAAPATGPTPTTVRPDVPTAGGLPVDAGAGNAGGSATGTSHGEGRHGRNPQDAPPGAMDGIPDPTAETGRTAARRAGGLDVMM